MDVVHALQNYKKNAKWTNLASFLSQFMTKCKSFVAADAMFLEFSILTAMKYL